MISIIYLLLLMVNYRRNILDVMHRMSMLFIEYCKQVSLICHLYGILFFIDDLHSQMNEKDRQLQYVQCGINIYTKLESSKWCHFIKPHVSIWYKLRCKQRSIHHDKLQLRRKVRRRIVRFNELCSKVSPHWLEKSGARQRLQNLQDKRRQWACRNVILLTILINFCVYLVFFWFIAKLFWFIASFFFWYTAVYCYVRVVLWSHNNYVINILIILIIVVLNYIFCTVEK